MVRHHKRAEEEAKVASGVLEALDGPVTVLPGVVSDDREIVKIDWRTVDARQMIPYPTALEAGDELGEHRRRRMDNLILGVVRYGEHALAAIAAGLGLALNDQPGYAVPTVDDWYKANVDAFRDRCHHAHGVFRGRLMFSVIDRADKPYVPRETFRDNLPLFAALNAFVPEHFKRGSAQININTGDQVVELHKTLVMVGTNLADEQRAIQEANA